MANTWKWYAVVIGTKDYHLLYETVKIVKARSAWEARKRALSKCKEWHTDCLTIGPMDNMPNLHNF